MTAFSTVQVQSFIVQCRQLSGAFTVFADAVSKLLDDEININQNFNQLDTDFPSMFVVGPDPAEEPDAVSSKPGGAPWPDPPSQTNPLKEVRDRRSDVEQPFSASDVKKFLDAVKEFKTIFIDAAAPTEIPSAKLGEEMRQLNLNA